MKSLNKVILVISFLLLIVNCSRLTLNAAVPHLINYQGRLTDKDNKPLEGAYALTFKIYNSEVGSGTMSPWQEKHEGVIIQKGIFSVLLGSKTNLDLPFDQQYFLEILIGEEGKEEVMSPRQRITSAGYAIRAEHGVPRGVIVMWSGRISDIPSGWALCDGTNGTPDLRDRFIIGGRQDDGGVVKTNITASLTQSGGSTSISVENLPPHTHGFGTLTTNSIGEHNHSTNLYGGYQGSGRNPPANPSVYSGTNNKDYLFTSSNGSHAHTLSGSTGATGSGTPYTQPYYALAFIMKL